MKNQEKAQQTYMELQMIERRFQQLQQQIQVLQQQSVELETIKQNLTETKKAKKGSTILVPLASGIFARAKIEDAEQLLVNVGAGVVVEKNVEDTKKMLDDQVNDARRVENKLVGELNQKAIEFQEKQQELQSLVQ